MYQVRFHDGFDDPDPIAFGLPAPELLVVVACSIAALLLIRSPLPRPFSVPAAIVVAGAGAGLGWLRWQGKTLLAWSFNAARFAVAPRATNLLLASSHDGDQPDAGLPASREEPRRHTSPTPPRAVDATDANSAWQQWLEPPAPQHNPGNTESETELELPLEEPVPLAVMDAPVTADAPHENDEDDDAPTDELPEGELEIDDDEMGVIIPFARAGADDLSDESEPIPHIAVADEVTFEIAGKPTAFVGAPRRITFFSLNGGTGKTTLCTEIAALLASRAEHTPNGVDTQRLKVAIIDLDLRSASLSVRLGIPQPTIWDFANNAGDVEDYMVRHRSGVNALLGPPKPIPAGNRAINPEMVADIVAGLEADGYHYIFFDVASDLNPTTAWVLNAVHDIFVVMTANASGIQDAYRTAAVLRRMGLRHKLSYVVNRTRSGIDIGPTMSDLGGKLVAEIPYDPRVEDAENSHRLVIEQSGPASDALTRLGAVIYPGLGPVERKARIPLPWRRRTAR